jgi:hypothetical protein
LVHEKEGTLLLSELNGIVYNFNANFAYYGPIIKIKRSEQYQKFKFLYRCGSIDYLENEAVWAIYKNTAT